MAQSISWGSVNFDGTIVSGSGDFLVTIVNTGQYQITFNNGFASIPAIVGSQNRCGDQTEMNTDSVCFPFVNQGFFQVNTGDDAGTLQNRNFAFIAIGNR